MFKQKQLRGCPVNYFCLKISALDKAEFSTVEKKDFFCQGWIEMESISYMKLKENSNAAGSVTKEGILFLIMSASPSIIFKEWIVWQVGCGTNSICITSCQAEPPKKPSNWRKKHEDFIATIRAAKNLTQVIKDGGPLPPPPPPTYDPGNK